MGPFTLLPLLGLALYVRRRLVVDPAVGLLCATSLVFLLLYCGALTELLLPVAIFLYFAGCLLLVAEIIRFVRADGTRELPVSLTLFAILGTAYWLRYSGTAPFFYDEYFWGIGLKELLAHDSLWGANTNVLYPRVVAGATIFQYWFVRFSSEPEGTAYLAQFTLLFVPMLCMLSGVQWRQAGWIAGVLALCFLAATQFSPGLSTLYLDHLLGAWFAGALLAFVLVRQDSKPAWILTPALSLAVLALLKRTGVAFAFSAGLVMAGLELAKSRRAGKPWSMSIFRALRTLALVVTPALLCTLLWEMNRDVAGAVDARPSITENTVSMERLMTTLSSETGREVTARFAEVANNVPLGNNDWFWQLNEFSYHVVDLYTGRRGLTTTGMFVVFGAWWAGLLFARRIISLHRDWLIIATGCLFTAIAYTGLIYGHYLANLSPVLPSYTRYMNTMVLALLLVSLAPLLPAFSTSNSIDGAFPGKRHDWARPALFFVALGSLYWYEAPGVSRMMLPNPPIEARRQLEPIAEELRLMIGQRSLWVYYPEEDPRAFNSAVLTYLLTPIRTKVVSSPDKWPRDAESFTAAISGFDYLLILESSEAFASDNPGAKALGLEPGLLMRITRNERGEFLIRPATP